LLIRCKEKPAAHDFSLFSLIKKHAFLLKSSFYPKQWQERQCPEKCLPACEYAEQALVFCESMMDFCKKCQEHELLLRLILLAWLR
jgi:hypothetical protein